MISNNPYNADTGLSITSSAPTGATDAASSTSSGAVRLDTTDLDVEGTGDVTGVQVEEIEDPDFGKIADLILTVTCIACLASISFPLSTAMLLGWALFEALNTTSDKDAPSGVSGLRLEEASKKKKTEKDASGARLEEDDIPPDIRNRLDSHYRKQYVPNPHDSEDAFVERNVQRAWGEIQKHRAVTDTGRGAYTEND